MEEWNSGSFLGSEPDSLGGRQTKARIGLWGGTMDFDKNKFAGGVRGFTRFPVGADVRGFLREAHVSQGPQEFTREIS